MLNIELAVLQTLDHEKWWSLSEISARTKIQEQSAAEALRELNQSGIVESRTNTVDSSTPSAVEWRSHDNAITNYLEGKVPF